MALEKLPISVVSACMKPDGTPTFSFNTVGVTEEERAEGLHYRLVEMQLWKSGYEEPFVHFDDTEAPDFLHPAVRRFLNLQPHVLNTIHTFFSEER